MYAAIKTSSNIEKFTNYTGIKANKFMVSH